MNLSHALCVLSGLAFGIAGGVAYQHKKPCIQVNYALPGATSGNIYVEAPNPQWAQINDAVPGGPVPTISAAGCGGYGASIVATRHNARGDFEATVNVGIAPNGSCRVWTPPSPLGFTCYVSSEAVSQTQFIQKQIAMNPKFVILQNYNQDGYATPPNSNDVWHLLCTKQKTRSTSRVHAQQKD